MARAILGEWLGGSGGGWQDSGGIFPGIKLIEGVAASEGDPEWGISRGRLLPAHRLLEPGARQGRAEPVADSAVGSLPEALAESLVVVHGGMAQNVGPILNMVTTKYLLRDQRSLVARLESSENLRRDRDGRPGRGRADDRPLHDPQLEWPAQADHPLGHQSLY